MDPTTIVALAAIAVGVLLIGRVVRLVLSVALVAAAAYAVYWFATTHLPGILERL